LPARCCWRGDCGKRKRAARKFAILWLVSYRRITLWAYWFKLSIVHSPSATTGNGYGHSGWRRPLLGGEDYTGQFSGRDI